jgi:hypothetical protein
MELALASLKRINLNIVFIRIIVEALNENSLPKSVFKE